MSKSNLAFVIAIAIVMMLVALANISAPTIATDSAMHEQVVPATTPRTSISDEAALQEDSEDEIGFMTPRMGIMPATGNIGIEVMPGLMIDMDGNIGVGIGF